MPDNELVVFALGWVGETAYALDLSKELEPVFSAGDDFVGVALMADVPEELVLLEIEDLVQCEGQFYDAEVARQMAACFAERCENKLAHLFCQVL